LPISLRPSRRFDLPGDIGDHITRSRSDYHTLELRSRADPLRRPPHDDHRLLRLDHRTGSRRRLALPISLRPSRRFDLPRDTRDHISRRDLGYLTLVSRSGTVPRHLTPYDALRLLRLHSFPARRSSDLLPIILRPSRRFDLPGDIGDHITRS